VALADRIEGVGTDQLWVTFDSAQSRSLLVGRRVEYISPIHERDIAGVGRGVHAASRILGSINARSVISTGSAIALAFLPYAAMRGIPAHFIESAARVRAPSLTGRVLEWIPGVSLYRQYPHAALGRWKFAGSVFDGFLSEAQEQKRVRRIVVSLGSGIHGFRRLIDRLVMILPADAEILWQTGSTPLDRLTINARPIVPARELETAVREADAVICHAGCGSALQALCAGKCPVLIPREPKHHELVDNHHIELARLLGEKKLAIGRTPESITFADVLSAAARVVRRSAHPPKLRLA
jgi:UDP-N-acetylglucosamine transferase subunit ALG13